MIVMVILLLICFAVLLSHIEHMRLVCPNKLWCHSHRVYCSQVQRLYVHLGAQHIEPGLMGSDYQPGAALFQLSVLWRGWMGHKDAAVWH